jgi:RNA polymerase sigma factor (sigma-70 family)
MKLHSLYSLHNLPDIDLIPLCLLHQRNAWEEFFKRFSPLIKKSIRRTFIKCGVKDLAEDIDNILDIHADIVEKLYAKGALNKCPDLSGLRAWLNRITINQTIEWLRERGRIKHLPLLKEEQLMRSLSTRLGEDSDFSLQDIIEDDDADLFAQLEQIAAQLYVECVIEQISTINNITHRWILRLNILGQLALSDAELESLQSISPFQRNELSERISALEVSLADKEQDRQDGLGKSVLYWHQLRNLEVKIARLDRDTFSDHKLEIDALKLEWTELENRKMKLLSNCHSLPKPTNREIAEIVGIPEDNCGNVSNYLVRAREALSNKMRNL